MTATLIPFPVFRAFDSDGAPLSGGLLYTYQAGTSTPLATYTDQSGNTANTNPVVLDSTGSANVWLGASSYKMVLKDADSVVQWTVDNVQSAQAIIDGFKADLANTSDISKGDALVGIKQPFSGAISTTQHEFNSRSFNVFDWFSSAQKTDVSSGTGSVDVTDAIQAAVEASAGGELVFPPGKYLIGTGINTDGTAAISLKSNSSYRGLGSYSLAPVNGSSSTTNKGVYFVWGGGDHGTMVDLINTWGASVKGISLVGNYNKNTHNTSNVCGYDIYTKSGFQVTNTQTYITDFSVEGCQFGVAFGFALGSTHTGGNMDAWIVERFRMDRVVNGFYLNSINVYQAEIRSGFIGFHGSGMWFNYSGQVKISGVAGYGLNENGDGSNSLFSITNNSGQLCFENCQNQPSGYEVTPYTFATFSGGTKSSPTTFIGCNIESIINVAYPQTHLTFIGNDAPSGIYLTPNSAGSNIISINDNLGAQTGFLQGSCLIRATLSGSSMTLTSDTLVGSIITGDVQYVYGTGITPGTTITSLTSGTANSSGAVYLLSAPVTTVATAESITGVYKTDYPGINLDIISGDGNGSWTPEIYQGSTHVGTGTGYWVKKGKMVHVKMDFNSSSVVTGSGNWQVKGLPYTSDAYIACVLQAGNITINGSEYSMNTPYWWAIGGSSTTALLYGAQSNTAWGSSSLNMEMSGTYQVA